MKLINSFKTFYGQYPRQYWLMIAGIIISTAGGSMILPFLVIYAGNKLNMPLSTVAALISINAGTGLISSFIAGTLADKVGRKAVMVFSLADMIPSEQRTDAYAITRIANNAAFAVGPAMGGFLATRSYNLAFYGASLGFITYSLLLFFRARETLVIEKPAPSFTVLTGNNVFQSYARVFQNKPFIIFVALVSLGLIAPTMLWILM